MFETIRFKNRIIVKEVIEGLVRDWKRDASRMGCSSDQNLAGNIIDEVNKAVLESCYKQLELVLPYLE